MTVSGNLIVPQCGYAGMRREVLGQLPKAESEKIFSSIANHNFGEFRIRNILPLTLEIQSLLGLLLKDIARSTDDKITRYRRALIYNYLQSVDETQSKER